MKIWKRAAWLALAVLFFARDALPQQPGQVVPPPAGPATPRRDQTSTTGTAVLKGQVVDATTGNPLRKARVSTTTPGMSTPSAQTDGEGRFAIRDLPAGKYVLDVSKTGYLSLAATNAGQPIPPIGIKDSETIDTIVLRPSRGGVITGHVVDDAGEPAVGVDVRVLRYRFSNGERQLSAFGPRVGASPVRTDDRGAFRLFGLEPGDYFVAARPAHEGRQVVPSMPDASGLAHTYFPGTVNPGDAKRITVRAARETSGVVIPMVATRLSRVRGRVIMSSGEPFSGRIDVSHRDVPDAPSNTMTLIRPGGHFEVSDLAPGMYLLEALASNWREGDGTERARAVVTVAGEDIENLTLVGGLGGIARGRVITDEGLPPPFVVGSYTLRAEPVDARLPNRGRPSRVRDDWTFEIRGIDDRVHLRTAGFTTAGPFGPWVMKSVLVDGRDVTDTGIDLRSGQVVENIELVYTRKMPRLSGELHDASGKPQMDGWVILFAVDESRWTPSSRWVRASGILRNGRYSMMPAPSDDYLIVGVTGIEEGQWADPEFLKSVKDLATRFSIDEGDTKVYDVRLVEWRK